MLGGEQDVAVAEARDEGLFHLSWHYSALVVGGRALRDGDGVRVGEAQAEALGALGKAPQIAAAVEEVVDELAARRLLFPYGEELCPFVALGEGVDDLLDRGKCAVGRAGRRGPGGAGRGQMSADEGAQAVAGVGGPLAKGAA